MTTHVELGTFCPTYHRAVELIGRRWTGVIVRAMLGGLHRFSDLGAAIPDLSDRMLSERLKELEAECVVVRRVIPETPVRIEYHLTDKGRALGAVIDSISDWAYAWAEPATSTVATAPLDDTTVIHSIHDAHPVR